MKRHDSIIKMTITTENYEFYALDYLEGNLDASTQKAMDQFLAQHPEILAEIEEMQSFILLEPGDDIIFEKKESLKREVGLNSTQKKRAIFQLWTRYATTAAVVLGLIWGTTEMIQNNDSVKVEVVEQNQQPKKTQPLNNLNEPKIEEEKQSPAEVVETIAENDTKVESQDRESAISNTQNPEMIEDWKDESIIAEVEKEDKVGPQTPIEDKESKLIVEDKQDPKGFEIEPTYRDFSTQTIAALDLDHQLSSNQITQKNAVLELSLLHESKVLVETFNTPKRKKGKEWKTPFGNIKWGEVVEAITPESYFASK